MMKKIACTILLSIAIPTFAADAPTPFPKKMEGTWGSNGSKKAEVELLQMESPTKAKLDVTFWDGCTRRGETIAEFNDGAWKFVAPGGVKCENITATVTAIAGTNKFEGTYETVFRGQVVKGQVYLEGKE